MGERGLDLLGFGMMMVELFLHERGKYPKDKHFRMSLWKTFCREEGRFFNMRLVMWSGPGDFLGLRFSMIVRSLEKGK